MIAANDIMLREEVYSIAHLSVDAKESAALVLSKVFSYLGQDDDALLYALRAGKAFQTEVAAPRSEEYVETVFCA